VTRLEGEISALEVRIAELEAALQDPAAAGDHRLLAARGEEHRQLQEELSWLMREWEAAAEATS
jgi:hypothetical protein